jgi:hypothetical protein
VAGGVPARSDDIHSMTFALHNSRVNQIQLDPLCHI